MPDIPDPLLTEPRYRIAHAARIAGRPVRTIRHWISSSARSGPGRSPVIDCQSQPAGRGLKVSFLEVAEIVAIAAMRRSDTPLQCIRDARAHMRDELGIAHPFAVVLMRNSGRRVTYELIGQSYRDGLASSGQAPAPLDGLPEFNAMAGELFDFEPLPAEGLAVAARIYPRSKHVPLVSDPHVRGGRVTIRGTSLTTDIVQGRVASGDSVALIADDFSITEEEVNAAIAFEASP